MSLRILCKLSAGLWEGPAGSIPRVAVHAATPVAPSGSDLGFLAGGASSSGFAGSGCTGVWGNAGIGEGSALDILSITDSILANSVAEDRGGTIRDGLESFIKSIIRFRFDSLCVARWSINSI